MMLLHVGGVFQRMEYVATGEPLVQAFHSEHLASPQEVPVMCRRCRLAAQPPYQVLISQQGWDLIKDHFTREPEWRDGCAVLDSVKGRLTKVCVQGDAVASEKILTMASALPVRFQCTRAFSGD